MQALAQETVLRGRGVHTGFESAVRIHRREDDGGLRFFWTGWPQPLEPKDLSVLKRRAQRATVLEGEAGQIFRTPEHLLAACLFFADAPLDIECNAAEPPGLDGSSTSFYQALLEVSGKTIPHWREYPSELLWEYEGPEGLISASPSDSFSIDYEWNKSPLKERAFLKTPAEAVSEILPARTFIQYREWLAAKGKTDLLSGADEDSGLLLAESEAEFTVALKAHPEFRGKTFPLLHPETFRMNMEPVRHKILDLLGDLALLGLALPRLRLKIRNGGHALNHLLLEQLLHERLDLTR